MQTEEKISKLESPWEVPSVRELVEDFPPGPLDVYRKKSTFDWKQMKMHFIGKDMIEFENRIWKTLEDDPLFQARPVANMSLQEARQLCFQRMKRIKEYKFCSDEEFLQNPLTALNLYMCVGMIDWSLSLKLLLGIEYFIMVLILSGKEKQWEFANEVKSFNVIGCFALTEMAHGTNTRGVLTTATFDPKSQMFVINTPTLEATKMWIGNLGQTATYAVLYAQLYTPDGQCHGLHAFLVPIRDPVTYLPFPGVTVGDLGPKLGLPGLDNGFMSFRNYKVPRESLLSRHGEVSVDGKYLTAIKDPKKRFGLSMGSLSLGRMGILTVGVSNLRMCMPIAVRYAAIRKQFGPPGGAEVPILEYQLHQYRILPYLAATYTLYHFVHRYNADLMELQLKFAYSFEKKDQKMYDQAGELHALCSAAKPVITWTARDAIQECREACGGHGYLEASGFGRLRNDNDANCTYEGDNNVLSQQTSNYLLGLLKKKRTTGSKFSHLQSVSFLDSIDEILPKKFQANDVEDCMDIKTLLHAYQWLVCYLLERSSHEFERLKVQTNSFDAKNNSIVFFCKDLSIAFMEHAVLQKFAAFINEQHDIQIANTLHRLGSLYGLWSIQKYYTVLHEGGYCARRSDSTIMKQAILQLCHQLKDDAVALVDVIAPPDYVLNSALGKSDGEVYKNLHDAIMSTPGALERAPWWQEFKKKPKVFSIPAKL